ncbi:MAG TPA: K+/H+ antiporter subunit F [Sphingomonadaceae bacterium]|nr:K+/H+ antiporter subunit F [Sphingomonadaceae bacterium]
MSTLILALVITTAQIILALAMACGVFRMLCGPRAQDRVLGMDSLYVGGMLLLLTYGIQTGRTLFFEGALVIALLGFAGTVALAKFLMRGEVIE